MKEIVVMTGATDPEKRLLTILETLFPECAIRIVYAGSDSGETHLSLRPSNEEAGKAV